MVNRKTYIIADTHFNHLNIRKYCSRPDNCDELTVRNWKKLVGKDDLIYVLGDVHFGKRSEISDWIENLPGIKILIKGNHDREREQFYLNHGFVAVLDFAVVTIAVKISNHQMRYDKILLSHEPIVIPSENRIVANIHGHLHNNVIEDWKKEEVQVVTSSHYLFCLEKIGYKPILLNRAIRDGYLIPTLSLRLKNWGEI